MTDVVEYLETKLNQYKGDALELAEFIKTARQRLPHLSVTETLAELAVAAYLHGTKRDNLETTP